MQMQTQFHQTEKMLMSMKFGGTMEKTILKHWRTYEPKLVEELLFSQRTQESPDAESSRYSRLADQSGENGEPSPVAGGDGSVEQADEAPIARSVTGNGRSGRGRRNQFERDGLVSLGFAEESEAEKPSRDYRITAESHIGEGSLRHKAQLNLDAIQLLKVVEREGRQATPDEQHILARYTGWGAMPAVFDYYTGRHDEWNEVRDTVRKLLTDEEHRAARASVAALIFFGLFSMTVLLFSSGM